MSSRNVRLNLKKFNITTIGGDSTVVMVGRRGAGKSYMIKDLMYYHTNIPIGTVISGTEMANCYFGDFVPQCFIHYEVEPEITSDILTRQKKISKKFKNEVKMYGGSKIDADAFLILDDCLYDSDWAKDKSIKFFFMNGRHLNLLFIITMQYPLGVPPNLRTNIDYTFIFKEPSMGNRKRIYENYASAFPSFEMFCQVLDQCTENYECLVVNNKVASTKLEDCVFWYKADQHPDFKLCNSKFWINNNVDNDSDDGSDYVNFNMDEYKYKKNTKKVVVNKK